MIVLDNLALIIVLPMCLEVLSPCFLKNIIDEFDNKLTLLLHDCRFSWTQEDVFQLQKHFWHKGNNAGKALEAL